jgi:hypothetical protein
LILAAFAAVAVAGCGDSNQDLDVAEQSVRAGLDAWQRGELPETLKQRETPIEFHDDDWQSGARLIDFTVENSYRDSAGGPRCTVQLTIELDGRSETKSVVYEAKVGSTVVVTRDPYS